MSLPPNLQASLPLLSEVALRLLALADANSAAEPTEALLSSGDMQQLVSCLTELRNKAKRIGRPLTDALFASDTFSAALLRILAAMMRLPEQSRAFNGAETLFPQAAGLVSDMFSTSAVPGDPASPSSGAVTFALKLLRMQTLHSCSRQLAAAAEDTLQRLQRLQPAAPVSTDGGEGPVNLLLDMLVPALVPHIRLSSCILQIRAEGTDDLAPVPVWPWWRPYVRELGAALRDSDFLEHTSRLALLRLQLKAGAAGGPPWAQQRQQQRLGTGPDALSTAQQNFLNELVFVVCAATKLHELIRICTHAGEAGAAAAIEKALCGRCVRHLALSGSCVAALCEADGGTPYGLPGVTRAALGFAASQHDDRYLSLSSMLRSSLLAIALTVGGFRLGEPPPSWRAALALALRTGRAAAAALEERQQEGEDDGDEAAGEPPTAATSNRLRKAVGHCGAAAPQRMTSAPAPPLPQQCPRRPVGTAVGLDTAVDLLLAVQAVQALLTARPPPPAALLLEAETERYRLLGRLVRRAPPGLHLNHVWHIGVELRLRTPLDSLLTQSGTLPAAAPVPVAAALAGGLPSTLEWLLRRAAAETSEAVDVRLGILTGLLESCGGPPDDDLGFIPAGLMAYVEPRRVASLIASLGKALWAPSGMAVFGTKHSFVAAATDCVLMDAAGWLARLSAAPPSPAAQQLALVASLAACVWLPVQARGPLGAATLRRLQAGTGGDKFVATSLFTFRTVLAWVPLLARLAAAEEEVAAGGSAAPPAPAPTAAAAAATAQSPVGGGSWRALLLEVVGAVAVLGVALGAARQLARGVQQQSEMTLLRDLADAACALAAVCPGEVLRAAVAAAAAAQAPGGGRSARATGRSRTLSPGWHPLSLRLLLPGLRAAGHAETAAAAEALAAQLERWGRGGSGDGGGGAAGDDGVSGGGSTPLPPHLLAATNGAALLASVPPATARRLLRTCARPACTNLTGGSEAELPLMACSSCRGVGYCSRECQTAHWHGGHREACRRAEQPGKSTTN